MVFGRERQLKSSALENVSVTLVEPEYPINVGYVARLLMNFGMSRLCLIEPKVDLRVAGVYASHGAELIRKAERTNFTRLRKSHDLLVATTAIRAVKRANVVRTVTPLEEAAKYVGAASSASLVFGRDTTGLTNEELSMCDIVTTVDTGTHYRTLNVSHAAAIILHFLSTEHAPKKRMRTSNAREMFVKYVQELALVSGLQQHRVEKLREVSSRIALKSGLNERELSLLIGLNRKALLAVRRGGWEDS
jgi:TrmH family RNA methyltransferase